MTGPVLEIEGLEVEYPVGSGAVVAAVKNFDLTIAAGDIHALVGESGAGKSTVASALIGLMQAPGRIAGGRIRIDGRDVNMQTGRAEGIVPGRDVGVIFQDPMTSLNPLFTIEDQLCEGMRFHLGLSQKQAQARALDLLKSVGIPEPERRLKAYPHQLSGGQRQRVVIASALSCEPRLIIADEPTTALDVSVQAQILKLIRSLVASRGLGVLLITHNMGVVAEVADYVTIMLKGEVVESGRTDDILANPRQPYSRNLIGAVPRLDVKLERLPVPADETPAARAARQEIRRVAATTDTVEGTILSVEGLTLEYEAGFLAGRGARAFRAVDDVSFSMRAGEIFGLVGESGCGKTTLANSIAGLINPTAGSITLGGEAVGKHRPRALRRLLQVVFQDPYSALNPRMRTANAIAEPVEFYKLASGPAAADEFARVLIEAVGLEASAGDRFPHAFSGGQRQRIAIARALGPRPSLLICDEPTSSLDVSVQAQILNLLKDLRDLMNLSILFISHDLAVVRQLCDRIAVMQSGRIIEIQDSDSLFRNPQHQFTRDFISLIPSIDKISEIKK